MAIRRGADLFGVASADDLNDAPRGHRPVDIFPDAKSIVVVGMKILDAQTDILPTEEDFFGAAPKQDMFRGHIDFISQHLDTIGYALARFLETKGFKAFHQIASTGGTDQRYLIGLLSLKHVALRAGLGVLGHSSLLLTPQYGPRVKLTAIVTNAKMQHGQPIKEMFCKHCESPCILFCPANALKKPSDNCPYEINKFACRQYLNTQPTCSICLKVCPIGNQRIR